MDTIYTSRNEIIWNNVDQCLEVDFSKMLNRSCKLFINGWQQGLEWYSEVGGGLFRSARFCSPGLNLLSQQNHPAITQWKATCPDTLVSGLAAYRVGQFELLQMCAQWREAYELFDECPLLLWLLHIISTKKKWPRHIIKSCLNFPPERIMLEIGLQGTTKSVEVLKRVVVCDFDLYDANLLMHFLGSVRLANELSSYVSITKYTLLALYRHEWTIGYPVASLLSEQAVTLQSYLELSSIIRECYDLAATDLEISELRQCLNIEDLEQFQRKQCYQKLRHIFNRSTYSIPLLERLDQLNIPLPPHPGTEAIQPVDTRAKLATLPSLVNCCLTEKIKMVLEKKYYFYIARGNRSTVLLGIMVHSGKLSYLNCVKYKPMPLHKLPTFIVRWLDSVLPMKYNLIQTLPNKLRQSLGSNSDPV